MPISICRCSWPAYVHAYCPVVYLCNVYTHTYLGFMYLFPFGYTFLCHGFCLIYATHCWFASWICYPCEYMLFTITLYVLLCMALLYVYVAYGYICVLSLYVYTIHFCFASQRYPYLYIDKSWLRLTIEVVFILAIAAFMPTYIVIEMASLMISLSSIHI